MPDMHSSIYSIMQDNLKSELKYYPVLGFSDAGFFSKKGSLSSMGVNPFLKPGTIVSGFFYITIFD